MRNQSDVFLPVIIGLVTGAIHYQTTEGRGNSSDVWPIKTLIVAFILKPHMQYLLPIDLQKTKSME